MNSPNPKAVLASDVPPRTKPSIYPEPFKSQMKGRVKTVLGDFFGIKSFGVNMTELAPGAQSALLHRHSIQEEFIYVISGRPTLILGSEEIQLEPGMCAGFIPEGAAHMLVNRSSEKVVYLEVGGRERNDEATYPKDDIVARMSESGQWVFTHKDGTPY